MEPADVFFSFTWLHLPHVGKSANVSRDDKYKINTVYTKWAATSKKKKTVSAVFPHTSIWYLRYLQYYFKNSFSIGFFFWKSCKQLFRTHWVLRFWKPIAFPSKHAVKSTQAVVLILNSMFIFFPSSNVAGDHALMTNNFISAFIKALPSGSVRLVLRFWNVWWGGRNFSTVWTVRCVSNYPRSRNKRGLWRTAVRRSDLDLLTLNVPCLMMHLQLER